MAVLGDTTVVLAIFSIAFILIYLLKRNDKKEDGRRRPPSLPSLPIVGSFPFFRGGIDDMPEFFLEKTKSLGPIFHFYSGSELAVVLNGRNAIADAFMKHAEAFADRNEFLTEVKYINVNLNGISFSRYHETYKRSHKAAFSILKEFGLRAIQEMETRIWEEVDILLKEIRGKDGRPFHPKIDFGCVSARIMMKILFGREFVSTIDPNEFIEAAHAFVVNLDAKVDNAPIIRFLPKYRRMLADMVKGHTRMHEILEDAIQYNRSLQSVEANFVKRFLEFQETVCDHRNFRYILRDLFSASIDTISSTLQWAIVEMANHLDIQGRVQRELDDVVPRDRLPSFQDKAHLRYTEATMMEIMRRHTVVPLALPHMTLKDTETCGYFIPKGCLVIPNLYSVHMDPKDWVDPDNFRPDRFLDEDNEIIGRDRIMPFGVGKRSCIGELLARQIIFILFASLVQQFDIRPPDGQDSISVTIAASLTVRPSTYQVRFLPRAEA